MVHSYDADLNRRLTLTQLLSFFQDIAWEHTEKVSCGFDYMASKNCIWALSRVEVEIDRLPFWNEHIILRTWSKGHDAIIADRDYEMIGEDGSVLLKATTMWVIMDMTSRRVQRIGNIIQDFPHVNRSSLGHRVEKIAEFSEDGHPEFVETASELIVWSDTDMNGHVNNASYLRWVLDAVPLEMIRNLNPTRLRMNFNSESRAGEHRQIRWAYSKEGILAHVVRAEDARELVRIHLCC